VKAAIHNPPSWFCIFRICRLASDPREETRSGSAQGLQPSQARAARPAPETAVQRGEGTAGRGHSSFLSVPRRPPSPNRSCCLPAPGTAGPACVRCRLCSSPGRAQGTLDVLPPRSQKRLAGLYDISLCSGTRRQHQPGTPRRARQPALPSPRLLGGRDNVWGAV